MLHKMSIAGIAMDPASNTPIILLKSEEDDQVVPIWIGLLEATSIASTGLAQSPGKVFTVTAGPQAN